MIIQLSLSRLEYKIEIHFAYSPLLLYAPELTATSAETAKSGAKFNMDKSKCTGFAYVLKLNLRGKDYGTHWLILLLCQQYGNYSSTK